MLGGGTGPRFVSLLTVQGLTGLARGLTRRRARPARPTSARCCRPATGCRSTSA
jgi:hypothetical protein